jgi:hypothetical protein
MGETSLIRTALLVALIAAFGFWLLPDAPPQPKRERLVATFSFPQL